MGYRQRPKSYEEIRKERGIHELVRKDNVLAIRLARADEGLLPDTSRYESKRYRELAEGIERFKAKFPMSEKVRSDFERWQKGDHPKLSEVYDLTSMPEGTPDHIVRIYDGLRAKKNEARQRLKKTEEEIINHLTKRDDEEERDNVI